MSNQTDTLNADPELSVRMLLSALPPMTLLPAGWLRERLDAEDGPAGASGVPRGDAAHADLALPEFLTAAEFGARRMPRRSADWVREQCARKRLADAYKEGGVWYIPSKLLSARPTAEPKSSQPQPKWLARSGGPRDGRQEQGND